MRRLLTVFFCLGLLASAVLVASPTAVASEQTTGTHVKACFYLPNGSPYGNAPIYLDQWAYSGATGYREVVIRPNGKTDATGCGTFFNVPTSGWFRVVTNWTFDQASTCGFNRFNYFGYSEWLRAPATGTYTFQRVSVNGTKQYYPYQGCASGPERAISA